MDINCLKPRKFLGVGRHELVHTGDLSKPYFVAVGCSVVTGTGIQYDDTWVNRLAEKLNLEHINLGLDGSSLEYQYDKILDAEKILTNAKFIIWMQSQPIRTHRLGLSKVLGDKLARVFLNDQLFRSPDQLGKLWQKVLKFYDLSKDKNIIYTNTWHWDPRLLLLLENKICKKDNRWIVNNFIQCDEGINDPHPGPKTHLLLAEKIHTHINTHFTELQNK